MFWKQNLHIPDLQDYIMFEIAQAASQQTRLSEQAKAEREKRQLIREEMIKNGTLPAEEGIIKYADEEGEDKEDDDDDEDGESFDSSDQEF